MSLGSYTRWNSRYCWCSAWL